MYILLQEREKNGINMYCLDIFFSTEVAVHGIVLLSYQHYSSNTSLPVGHK